jgi:hypothetical protein
MGDFYLSEQQQCDYSNFNVSILPVALSNEQCIEGTNQLYCNIN